MNVTFTGVPLCQRRDSRNLPPADEETQNRLRRVLEERNVVQVTGHEAMRDVPVRRAVIAVDVVIVHHRAAAVRVRRHVAGTRPRVVRVRLQPVAVALPEDEADRVVIGDQIVGDDPALAEFLTGPPRIDVAARSRRRLVVEEAAIEVARVRTDILDVQRQCREPAPAADPSSTGPCARSADRASGR